MLILIFYHLLNIGHFLLNLTLNALQFFLACFCSPWFYVKICPLKVVVFLFIKEAFFMLSRFSLNAVESQGFLYLAFDLIGMHSAAAYIWAVTTFSYSLFEVCLSVALWRTWNLFLTVNVYYLVIRGAYDKFPDFFAWAFKIGLDFWTFSMLLLYILWDDWPIFVISGSNEQLQQELEYTLLKPDCHGWWISKMQSWRKDTLEERYAIKFCFKLVKMPQKRMECFKLLFDYLSRIEHRFLSGIRDSRKVQDSRL